MVKTLTGAEMRRGGEQYVRSRFAKGDLYIEIDGQGQPANAALINDVVGRLMEILTGLAAAEQIGTVSPGAQRRANDGIRRLVAPLSIGVTETASIIERLAQKAELLAVSQRPAIQAITELTATNPAADDATIDHIATQMEAATRTARIEAISAEVVARERAGSRVRSVTIDGLDNPLAGIAAEYRVAYPPQPQHVTTLLDIRDTHRKSCRFQFDHADEITAVFDACRNIRRGRATTRDIIDPWWSLERALDAIIAIDPPTRAVLAARAQQATMEAWLSTVITTARLGVAVPDFIGIVEALMALCTIAASPRDACRQFAAGEADARAFVAREQPTITAMARELETRGHLDSAVIDRVLGRP